MTYSLFRRLYRQIITGLVLFYPFFYILLVSAPCFLFSLFCIRTYVISSSFFLFSLWFCFFVVFVFSYSSFVYFFLCLFLYNYKYHKRIHYYNYYNTKTWLSSKNVTEENKETEIKSIKEKQDELTSRI